jgi:WD40 repeat protein/uncharacterized caspase-like protein
MNNFRLSGRRKARVRVASWLRFAVSLLLIFSFVSSISTRAQSPTPQTGGEQDKRGIVVRPGSPQQTATPEEQKARGARPELVLQTGYTFFGTVSGMRFSPDGRLLATHGINSSQVKLWEVATGRELRTLVAGGGGVFAQIGGVRSVAFSRDGKLIAAGAMDGSIKIWDVTTGREVRSIAGDKSDGDNFIGVYALAFGADNRTLVSHGLSVKFWDVGSGQVLRELNSVAVSGGMNESFALTPDGNQVALVVSDPKKLGESSVKFIEIASGREARTVSLPGELERASNSTLKVTGDGRLLAASEEYYDRTSRRLKLWDVSAQKGRVLFDIPEGKNAYNTFSADGRLLSTALGNTVRLWDTTTGSEVRAIDVPNRFAQFMPESFVFATAFSPDGRLLATSGNDSRISLWDTATGRAAGNLVGHANPAYEAAFSPDGTRLFAGGKTVWDVATGRGLRASRLDMPNGLGLLSRDGRLLAVRRLRDKRIELYDAATQKLLHTLAPAEQASVDHIAFSPDGRFVATTYVLDVEQTREKFKAAMQPDSKDAMKAAKEAMKAAQNDPSAYMRIYGEAMAKQSGAQPGIENQVKLWDTATGAEVRTITVTPGNPYMTGRVAQLAFSSDGRSVAVATGDATGVSLWDVATGRQLRTLGGPAPSAQANAQNPLAGMMGGAMGNIGAAMSSTGLGSGDSISSMAFSGDGRLMAVGGKTTEGGFDMAAMMSAAMASGGKRPKGAATPDPNQIMKDMLGNMKVTGTVKIMDVSSGAEVIRVGGHASQVQAVAFSADARLMASAAADNTIKIWDAATGRELHNITGEGSSVNSLAFSPDGALLASASVEGSTLLWDLKTGERLATLISVGDGGDWLVVTPDGLFDGSPAAWNQILWRFSQDTFAVEPVETFFNEFFYPGLLSDISSGKRPHAPRDISLIDRRQPVVGLTTSVASGAQVSTRTLSVSVRVEKAEAGAKDVRLFRNGSLVRVWHGDVLKGQPSATLEATIPVVAGENRLVAYAFNRDNVKSADAEALITGAGELKRAGTAYVLAVGVNSYANAQYNLKYAVADAQSFAEEVKRQQTQLGKNERVEVVSLIDSDATKANILAALKLLAGSADALPANAPKLLAQFKQAQPEDTVVVYFAGHGTAHGNRFYLIPHDLGYAGGRDALDASGLKSMLEHSVSDEELQAAVESLDAAQLLLVIDACNSGQALEAEEKRRGPMNSKGLAQLAYEKGMYILTAAQSYQAALEAAQLGHGLLTYALVEEGLKAMAADGEPRDGVLQARELLDFATDRVPQMQLEKMKQARALNINIAFAEGDEDVADPEKRSVQRPRAFYRREMETTPLVLARKQ